MTPTREQATGFDAYWQARCLETWQEMGQDKERGPIPSKDWGESYKRAAQHAYAAARAQALEDAKAINKAKADKMEREAQAARDNGEHDEVSWLLASALLLTVCAADIKALKGKQ